MLVYCPVSVSCTLLTQAAPSSSSSSIDFFSSSLLSILLDSNFPRALEQAREELAACSAADDEAAILDADASLMLPDAPTTLCCNFFQRRYGVGLIVELRIN